MSKIGEDIEMKDRQHEDRAEEQAQREEETDFIRDDGFKDDFERLRNDFNRRGIAGEFNFNLEHKGKDGYDITFPDLGTDDTFDFEEEREEIRKRINYVGLHRVFERLRGSGDFRGLRIPSYDWLKRNLFLERIDIRFNKEGKIIGLAYKPMTDRAFDIIVKKPGANPTDLIFSKNTNPKDGMQEAIDMFKKEFTHIKERYETSPSDITQGLVDDTFYDAEDDASVISDEKIWAENQLTVQTRKAVFEEAEAKMEEYRDDILEDIENENKGENPFPNMDTGQDFYTQTYYITGLTSNEDWFTDEAWSLEGKRRNTEVYESEMNDIADFRRELNKRIKKATSGKQIMVYETLKGYLDYKEVSLKTYFDKKLQENRIVNLYRRLQRTKFYRRGVIKAARLVAERFPKALAGAVLGVITTAFGIYEAVEDMASDVVSEGAKAINNISKKVDKVVKEQKKMIDKAVGNLDKRLRDAAEKQGKLVKGALDELRKTLQPSSKLLKFLLDHILWVILVFVLWLILITYLLTKKGNHRKAPRPRVRVKYEHESSDGEASRQGDED